MRTSTVAVAERLRQALVAERAATANRLALMVDLALEYRVEDDAARCELAPELSERMVPIGGDGCPLISEFFTLELACMLGVSTWRASNQLHQALNLRFRHPVLWQAVQELEMESWRGLQVARMCDWLPALDALVVTDKWWPKQAGLNDKDALKLVEELIAKQRPDLVAERERAKLAARFVSVGRYQDGVMQLHGQLDPLDARYIDARVEQMADILRDHDPNIDGETRGELRARALGVLANPAQALAWLQRASQQPLPFTEDPDGDPDDGSWRRPRVPSPEPPASDLPVDEEHDTPAARTPQCGHTCGSITLRPEELQPKAVAFIHIPADAITKGVARIEQAGVITVETLRWLLADRDVVVQPVIDLPEMAPEPRYRPSKRLRQAVELAFNDHTGFPYSSRPASRLDIDHIHAWRVIDPDRYTRLEDLMLLDRRAHRAKTAGHWHAEPEVAGVVHWRTPLGYGFEVGPFGTKRLDPAPAALRDTR